MRVRNLTGADIDLYNSDDEYVTLPSEGRIWLTANYTQIGSVDVDGADWDVPLLDGSSLRISGLPSVEPDTLVVVQGLVSAQLRRHDLVSPARIVREKGVPVGCRAFLAPPSRAPAPAC